MYMKNRSTTPVRRLFSATRIVALFIVVSALVVAPFVNQHMASAEVYDAEIKALEQDISQYAKDAEKLSKKRQTYETQLAKLTNERDQIQAKLNLSVARAKKLQAEIKGNEDKITLNKKVLGETIADSYVNSDISPLEMLASSKNIAEYVDKQAHQEQVQKKLQETIDKIDRLKKELEKQKKDVENVIADQNSQKSQLVQKENEKKNLISQTRGKESAFQDLVRKNERQKSVLEQKQQEAIAARYAANNRGGGGGSAVAGSSSRGGYPSNLANAPQDSLVDPWGMYNRECVSYTAWKVYQKNGYMPYWGGRGNANQWPSSARAAGIATGTTPRAGSTGVISAGTYGHIVWVEKVNSDGTINISQYNEYIPGLGWGQYSERYNVSPSTYDTYIYW